MPNNLPRKLIGSTQAQEFATEWNKIPDELDRLGFHNLVAEAPLEIIGVPGAQLLRLTQVEIRRWARLTTATYGGYSGAISADLLDWDGAKWVPDGGLQPLVYLIFASGYFFGSTIVEVKYNDTADRWYVISAGASLVCGRLATTLARGGSATLNEHFVNRTTGGMGIATGRTLTIVDASQLVGDNSPLAVNVRCSAGLVADGQGAMKLIDYDCDLEV